MADTPHLYQLNDAWIRNLIDCKHIIRPGEQDLGFVSRPGTNKNTNRNEDQRRGRFQDTGDNLPMSSDPNGLIKTFDYSK